MPVNSSKTLSKTPSFILFPPDLPKVATVCRIVALASMETKSWENARPATEPVRLAPAWATTNAAAVKKGCGCGVGRVSGPQGSRWKVRSGTVGTCQPEAQDLLCLPPSLTLFSEECFEGESHFFQDS